MSPGCLFHPTCGGSRRKSVSTATSSTLVVQDRSMTLTTVDTKASREPVQRRAGSVIWRLLVPQPVCISEAGWIDLLAVNISVAISPRQAQEQHVPDAPAGGVRSHLSVNDSIQQQARSRYSIAGAHSGLDRDSVSTPRNPVLLSKETPPLTYSQPHHRHARSAAGVCTHHSVDIGGGCTFATPEQSFCYTPNATRLPVQGVSVAFSPLGYRRLSVKSAKVRQSRVRTLAAFFEAEFNSAYNSGRNAVRHYLLVQSRDSMSSRSFAFRWLPLFLRSSSPSTREEVARYIVYDHLAQRQISGICDLRFRVNSSALDAPALGGDSAAPPMLRRTLDSIHVPSELLDYEASWQFSSPLKGSRSNTRSTKKSAKLALSRRSSSRPPIDCFLPSAHHSAARRNSSLKAPPFSRD